jgi:dCTP deaminase
VILSHQSIENHIAQGTIIIGPEFDKKNVRPVGLRIHLAKEILIPAPDQTVTLSAPQDLVYKEVDLTQEEFYLEPNQFILGATYESIKTPADVLTMLDGRSTVARLGITTHVTAAIAEGTIWTPHVIVLEIKNVGNFRVRLQFKDAIAMVIFMQIDQPITQQDRGQYGTQQTKVTPPNLRFRG